MGNQQPSYSIMSNKNNTNSNNDNSRNNIIDFNLFKTTSSNCDSTSTQYRCEYIKRIINALKYYQSLNDEEQKIQFCSKTYQSLLDDYIHIITHHNNDMDEIFDIMVSQFDMTSCDFTGCSLLTRHYRDRTKKDENHSEDEDVVFYRDTMDSIHCYLYHLYDDGLRIKMDDIKYDDNECEIDEKQHFDSKLSNICKVLQEKKNAITQLNGFDYKRYGANKFSINVKEQSNKDPGKDITYMDGLYVFLKQRGIGNDEIKRIKCILDDDNYDSDALLEDIGHIDRHRNKPRLQTTWDCLYWATLNKLNAINDNNENKIYFNKRMIDIQYNYNLFIFSALDKVFLTAQETNINNQSCLNPLQSLHCRQ